MCVTFLATEDELAGVDALSSDEQLGPFLEPVRVTEGHLGKWSSTAGVMNDVLNKTEAFFFFKKGFSFNKPLNGLCAKDLTFTIPLM